MIIVTKKTFSFILYHKKAVYLPFFYKNPPTKVTLSYHTIPLVDSGILFWNMIIKLFFD